MKQFIIIPPWEEIELKSPLNANLQKNFFHSLKNPENFLFQILSIQLSLFVITIYYLIKLKSFLKIKFSFNLKSIAYGLIGFIFIYTASFLYEDIFFPKKRKYLKYFGKVFFFSFFLEIILFVSGNIYYSNI